MSIKAVERIGSGVSSEVYIGVYDGMKVALKRIDSNNYSQVLILQEIEVLKLLSSKNNDYIIKYEGDSKLNKQYVIMTKYLEDHITLSKFISSMPRLR